jgi:hypothetical protein
MASGLVHANSLWNLNARFNNSGDRTLVNILDSSDIFFTSLDLTKNLNAIAILAGFNHRAQERQRIGKGA